MCQQCRHPSRQLTRASLRQIRGIYDDVRGKLPSMQADEPEDGADDDDDDDAEPILDVGRWRVSGPPVDFAADETAPMERDTDANELD